MCCDFGTPCALRALPKRLAATPSPHAMSRPTWKGSKGQNQPARPEHPLCNALWRVLGSRSIRKSSTRAPSIHHIKGGQGHRVKFSPGLSTPRGNTCHGVVHIPKRPRTLRAPMDGPMNTSRLPYKHRILQSVRLWS